MSRKLLLGALAVAGFTALPALAQDGDCDAGCATPSGVSGQVNVSGATLFADFFLSALSTNDWIDADLDGTCGPSPTPPVTDQLAEGPAACDFTTVNPHWLFTYRGVGSVNGLGEFVDFQVCGDLPSAPPSDEGITNGVNWYSDGFTTICPVSPYADGAPIELEGIDLAVLDVPASWATRVNPPAFAFWQARPGQAGYGENQKTTSTGDSHLLESFTRSIANGDSCDGTLTNPFDTQVAWVPISIIGNHGVGIETFTVTELQYHFTTGRLPNGLNLKAATRDVGSGTRNGAMNSLCIDPSWGIGDNLGDKFSSSSRDVLGPDNQWTQCGGSSRMEASVINNRLAVGYTGLFGGSRSAADAAANRYEIQNVIFDTNGGTQPVRPSVTAVLENTDVDSGWQIGGPETFVSAGDPFETNPNSPNYMANQAAADYLRNIVCSLRSARRCAIGNDLMPGELIVIEYIALASIDGIFDASTCSIVTNPNFNQDAQDCAFQEQTTVVPPYGKSNGVDDSYNLVPIRSAAGAPYADTSPDGDYYNYHTDAAGAPSISGGDPLNSRNAIAGDFTGNGTRDAGDAAQMAKALTYIGSFTDMTTYVTTVAPSSTSANPFVPEIVGDLTGEGNFDCEDARYYADGLYLVNGQLDRKAGFIAFDDAYFAETGVYLFGPSGLCPTVWACGTEYQSGDARFDVAGGSPTPGALPVGADGVIDGQDVKYILQNQGDWSDIDAAQFIDLSCDVNGDLKVDICDANELLNRMGMPLMGDFNGDGVVDTFDIDGFIATLSASCSF